MGNRAAEVEITTAGGSKKQKEEGKGEKERERDERLALLRGAHSEESDDPTYISAFVIAKR